VFFLHAGILWYRPVSFLERCFEPEKTFRRVLCTGEGSDSRAAVSSGLDHLRAILQSDPGDTIDRQLHRGGDSSQALRADQTGVLFGTGRENRTYTEVVGTLGFGQAGSLRVSASSADNKVFGHAASYCSHREVVFSQVYSLGSQSQGNVETIVDYHAAGSADCGDNLTGKRKKLSGCFTLGPDLEHSAAGLLERSGKLGRIMRIVPVVDYRVKAAQVRAP